MMVEKMHTWDDNWNDVIRDVLFQDEILKRMMMVPKNTTVVEFIEKYFIKDAAADEFLIDEKVRIVYYDTPGGHTNHMGVRLKNKDFDIYVKSDFLYNATNDRLKSRCNLIAERIKYLLLRNTYICGLRFNYEDEFELWTKVVGYKRYHIIFSYNTTV